MRLTEYIGENPQNNGFCIVITQYTNDYNCIITYRQAVFVGISQEDWGFVMGYEVFKKLCDEKVARMAKKRFDELSEEYDEIAETLTELEAVKPLQAGDVRDYLSQFCTGDPTDPAFQKKIINAIVNCLYVWDDKLLIYYNVKQNGDRVDHAQAADDAEFCSNSILVYRKNNTTNRICFRGQYVIVLCTR